MPDAGLAVVAALLWYLQQTHRAGLEHLRLPEVHGSADAYAAPGVALAWGVLRGADERATVVVVRIVWVPVAVQITSAPAGWGWAAR